MSGHIQTKALPGSGRHPSMSETRMVKPNLDLYPKPRWWGGLFPEWVRQVISHAGLNCLLVTCSGSTCLHRWREGKNFYPLTIVMILERTLVRSGRLDSLQVILVSDSVGVLGSWGSRASYHLFRGFIIYSSPTLRVAMFWQTLVWSGRSKNSLQILLVSDLVGVFSRGDYCASFQILRGSVLKITRRRGDRTRKSLLEIEIWKLNLSVPIWPGTPSPAIKNETWFVDAREALKIQ